MKFEIRPVRTRSDWVDFFQVARRVYQGDPDWVPPLERETRRLLDARQNPYFQHANLELLVLRKGPEPLARASVVIDRNFRENENKAPAFIGFFECADDSDAAAELMGVVEDHCIEHGATHIKGPFNPHYFGEIGLQVDGFGSPPSFFQPYNPPYYRRFFEGAGYREAHRICTARCDNFSEKIQKRFKFQTLDPTFSGYRVRTLELLRLGRELDLLRTLLNDAFAENWGFHCLSKSEYEYSARRLRFSARADLVSIVEHNSHPVAALVCALNVNPIIKQLNGRLRLGDRLRLWRAKSKIRHLMLFEIGIRRGERGWPLGWILLQTLARMARGYDTLETTWMSTTDGNAMRLAQWAGFEQQKSFAVYEKEIAPR